MDSYAIHHNSAHCPQGTLCTKAKHLKHNRRRVRVDTLLGCSVSYLENISHPPPSVKAVLNFFLLFLAAAFHPQESRSQKQRFLFLAECAAGRLLAFACAVALDVHVLCMAFIIAVVHTITSLTVDADRPARMLQRTHIGIAGTFCRKTFATRVIRMLRMLSSHHDVAFTTTFTFVVYATLHATI